MIQDRRIDAGKGFDWGRTSQDYAKYRDIYPEEFYQKIIEHGLCTKGQQVLGRRFRLSSRPPRPRRFPTIPST